jgi:transcriptional regulator with XRE-family HTH domain
VEVFVEQLDAIPVRILFLGTIDALSDLLKKCPPKQRDALRRAVATLRETLPQAEKEQAACPQADVATELHLSAGIIEPESTESRVLKAWGKDLEQRRKAAGLTRKVLAERAGISESTLRNVETARRPPTRMTIMHLQSVPELRIDPSPIGQHITGRRQRVQDFSPNCWLAPEYDALKLHNELTMQLNGRGGHIEQTYLYLDHPSAAAWCAIAEQEVYTTARNLMPLGRVAERIRCDWLGLWRWQGRSSTHAALVGSTPQPQSSSVPARHKPASLHECLPTSRRGAQREAHRVDLCNSGQLSQLATVHTAAAFTRTVTPSPGRLHVRQYLRQLAKRDHVRP